MNIKQTIENKEEFSVELIVEISAEEFEVALANAYKKNRGTISVPGFRKGKAPRKIIESMYGAGVFYQDALEEVYPGACEWAVAEAKLDAAAPPKVEIMDVGKDGVTLSATITVRPEVELARYKGLTADKVLATVTDDAVEQELKTYIDRATRLETVERAAEDGDTALIDFEGFQNDIPFDGGKGENFDLVLGSHSFIPGFEEQVVGMSAGETREIDVTFPEGYQAEELAGKPAKFRVKLHEVKAKLIPPLDDEFAKDVSEFDTLEAFKLDLRAKIAERNMAQADNRFKQLLVDQLAEQVTIKLPEPMVELQTDRMFGDYTQRLEQQGITMEMYLSYMQMTEANVREQLRPGAEKQIRTNLALDAIVKAEGIKATEEEVTADLQSIADSAKISLDEVREILPLDTFRKDMARDRAMKLVVENATANLITEEEALKIEEVKAEEVKAAEVETPEAPAAEAKPKRKSRAKPKAEEEPKGEE
jgi:trigger factor